MTAPLRILLSNDDGIHAPGLKVLESIARQLSDDIWIVAPEREQSGASHSLSLSDPLRLRQIDARKFAVQGTPTDCVMMAVKQIIPGRKPDLLLSGVNRGLNIAEDITYSGTIAAAMEGTQLGLPSIAMSQAYSARGQDNIKWRCAETHGPEIIKRLLEAGWPDDVLININFPNRMPDAVAGVSITEQGRWDDSHVYIDARVDVRGNEYYWLGHKQAGENARKGTDVYAIYHGEISITPLHLNLTHYPSHKQLGSYFSLWSAAEAGDS